MMVMAAVIHVHAQCKTFIIGKRGDTLNCTDYSNLKQGKWINKIAPLRGEPGYEEEGIYKDDKKTGAWRLYNRTGDLTGMENYKWGYKDGKNYYYNIYGLLREESWRATNPENPYDTIEVPSLDGDAIFLKVVKVDASTVKFGTWKYYNPQYSVLLKSENYVLDTLVPGSVRLASLTRNTKDTLGMAVLDSSARKPPEVLEYEKKNKKKKIKVRDGVTGVN